MWSKSAESHCESSWLLLGLTNQALALRIRQGVRKFSLSLLAISSGCSFQRNLSGLRGNVSRYTKVMSYCFVPSPYYSTSWTPTLLEKSGEGMGLSFAYREVMCECGREIVRARGPRVHWVKWVSSSFSGCLGRALFLKPFVASTSHG